MFKTSKYKIWPNETNFGEVIKSTVSKIITEYNFIIAEYGYRKWDNLFHVTICDSENYTCDSDKEFYSVLESNKSFERFTFHICFKKRFRDQRFGVGIDFDGRNIEIGVHADRIDFVDHVTSLIERELSLQKGFSADKDKYRYKMLDPKIFISRHFDKTGDDYYNRIEPLLTKLGFDVLQGEDYSAAAIPEKVKHKIEKQDIIIVLVTGDREHDWLTAEIGFAVGKDKHIVILKEKESVFNTTIMGKDFEYIQLEYDKIDIAFLKILNEFRQIGIKGLFN
jgi:hypothetical protein